MDLIKYGAPPKYVRPLTQDELHVRLARIIYLNPGGKAAADAAADAVIALLKREGLIA